MTDYTIPQTIQDFCSEEEIENLPNHEHLMDVLGRILQRLDNLEKKK